MSAVLRDEMARLIGFAEGEGLTKVDVVEALVSVAGIGTVRRVVRRQADLVSFKRGGVREMVLGAVRERDGVTCAGVAVALGKSESQVYAELVELVRDRLCRRERGPTQAYRYFAVCEEA